MFFFSKNSNTTFKPNSIEYAYLLLLKGDLLGAQNLFKTIDSPRARWGVVLVDILNGYMEHFPTYFSIRNFLEIDLDFLLKNEKIEYVELILGALKILMDINQETYKYVARVMLENKLYKSAYEYLNIIPDYYPAKLLQKEISRYLA